MTRLNLFKNFRFVCDECLVIEGSSKRDRIIESVSRCTTLVEKLISPDMELQKTEQQSNSLNKAVKPSYAEIASDKSSVILKPKIDNNHQSVSVNKKDLLVNIDPVKSNIKISKVRDGRDGSVIITCDNSDDSNKIKDMISNYNLPNYTFKQLFTLKPRIRVSSIDESIKQEQLLDYVVNQNKSLFGTNYTCKLIQFTRPCLRWMSSLITPFWTLVNC
jgi:hypothetical protein